MLPPAGWCSSSCATQHSGLRQPQDRGAETTLCIVGDLHLEPDSTALFRRAQEQINRILSDPLGQLLPGAGIVQLGDLGGYTHQPGA